MKPIWHQKRELKELQQKTKGNMLEHIGIEITAIGEDYLEGTMPVDHRTKQTFGLLHGGASVVLAESLGSMAANLCVDQQKEFCVGMEINANHLRPMESGKVFGKAKPIQIGKSVHVWEIHIRNQKNKLICISRLTMSVRKRGS